MSVCSQVNYTVFNNDKDFDEWLKQNEICYFVKDDSENEPFRKHNLDQISHLFKEIPLEITIDQDQPLDELQNFKQNLLVQNKSLLFSMYIKNFICNFTLCSREGIELFPEQTIEDQISLDKLQKDDSKFTNVMFIEIAEGYDIFLPHITTNYGMKIFMCPVLTCQTACTRIANMKIHSLKHLNLKPYKCTEPKCNWEFLTASKLARHMETHSERVKIQCSFPGCERTFTTLYNLNHHKQSHLRLPKLKCPFDECQQMFYDEKERKLHCKSHDISESPFKCPYSDCEKPFFTYNSLQVHVRSHMKKPSLVCHCGKAFDVPYKLKEHSRQHTGTKPYICSYENCTWRFATASKLKRHQSTHLKDRKFCCTIGKCNKSFLRSEHLKNHTITHIGQRIESSSPNEGSKTDPLPVEEVSISFEPQESSEFQQQADLLLEKAIQSLGVVTNDCILDTTLPEEILENHHFSTVNLKDLD